MLRLLKYRLLGMEAETCLPSQVFAWPEDNKQIQATFIPHMNLVYQYLSRYI